MNIVRFVPVYLNVREVFPYDFSVKININV